VVNTIGMYTENRPGLGWGKAQWPHGHAKLLNPEFSEAMTPELVFTSFGVSAVVIDADADFAHDGVSAVECAGNFK